jgi:hypothetical protein
LRQFSKIRNPTAYIFTRIPREPSEHIERIAAWCNHDLMKIRAFKSSYYSWFVGCLERLTKHFTKH